MVKQDAKLVDYSNYYDFSIDAAGDIESADSFDSTLIVSLFADARALASEVPISQNRRGWIGNIGYSYDIGSKLWLYMQSRVTDETVKKINDEIKSALKFLVDDGFVKSIDVATEKIDFGIGFTVTINRFNSTVDTRYFEMWNNTGE